MLATIAADPEHLGAQLAVYRAPPHLGPDLQHHPHVHCVVPGGGLSLDSTRWIACRRGFLLPVRVLSRLFRRLFLRDLQNAFDTGNLRFFGKLSDRPELILDLLPASFAFGELAEPVTFAGSAVSESQKAQLEHFVRLAGKR